MTLRPWKRLRELGAALEDALERAERYETYYTGLAARHDALLADYSRVTLLHVDEFNRRLLAERELATLKGGERPKLTKAEAQAIGLREPCIHCGGAHAYLCPMIQTITYYPAYAASQEKALTEVERIERIEYVPTRYAELWPQVAEFPDEEEAA